MATQITQLMIVIPVLNDAAATSSVHDGRSDPNAAVLRNVSSGCGGIPVPACAGALMELTYPGRTC